MNSLNHIQIMLDFMSEKNMGQVELAKRLEVDPGTISRWLTSEQGISKKNKSRIEFICGTGKKLIQVTSCPITKKILEKVNNLSESEKWEIYDYITQNYSNKNNPYKISDPVKAYEKAADENAAYTAKK